jgi:uncharacterized protein YcaQ
MRSRPLLILLSAAAGLAAPAAAALSPTEQAMVRTVDSERDRKKNELVVRKLHWEGRKPAASVVSAVNQAVDELREFVRTG